MKMFKEIIGAVVCAFIAGFILAKIYYGV